MFIFIKIVWLPTFSHPIVQMYNITFQSLYVTLIKRFLTIRRKTNSGGEGTKIPGTKIPRDENPGDENSGTEIPGTKIPGTKVPLPSFYIFTFQPTRLYKARRKFDIYDTIILRFYRYTIHISPQYISRNVQTYSLL